MHMMHEKLIEYMASRIAQVSPPSGSWRIWMWVSNASVTHHIDSEVWSLVLQVSMTRFSCCIRDSSSTARNRSCWAESLMMKIMLLLRLLRGLLL